jgi:chromosome segregation ATPase
VSNLISWKHSFKRLNEEYEIAKKKKQALSNLLKTGRISQPTYDVFSKEIDEAIAETDAQQQALLEKMNSKTRELEAQIGTLEMLFANLEIEHVAAEVNDEVYQREISLLSTGLETARQELDDIKEAMNQLSCGVQDLPTDVITQIVKPSPLEETNIPKTATKTLGTNETSPSPNPQQALQTTEEAHPAAQETEGAQKQKT